MPGNVLLCRFRLPVVILFLLQSGYPDCLHPVIQSHKRPPPVSMQFVLLLRESLLRVAYQMPLTCARIANVTHRAFELGPHQRGRTLSCWVEVQ